MATKKKKQATVIKKAPVLNEVNYEIFATRDNDNYTLPYIPYIALSGKYRDPMAKKSMFLDVPGDPEEFAVKPGNTLFNVVK